MEFVSRLIVSIINISRGCHFPIEQDPFSIFFLLYAKKVRILKNMDLEYLAFWSDKNSNYDDNILLELYGKFQNVTQLSFNNNYAYRSLVMMLNDIEDKLYQKYYCDLIEGLISHLAKQSGMTSAEFCQPQAITRLVGELVKRISPRFIYNPFAGLCSYALISNKYGYYGQEKDTGTNLLARVRLDAHGRNADTLAWADSIQGWNDHQADMLVTTPPFGAKATRAFSYHRWRKYRSLNEFILRNFLYSPSLENAVIILPASACFGADTLEIRKSIIEKNALDMIIDLPAGIFYGTGIRTVAIVLKKHRHLEKVTFVNGSDCINITQKAKDLDVDLLLSYIDNNTPRVVANVNYTEISERNFSWSPSAYITTQDALAEGQTYVLLSECIVPGKNIPIEAEKGIILSPSDFSDDVNLLFTAQNFTTAQISPNMKAYQGEHIVLSFLQNKIKICKCSFDEPFFVNQNQVAFALKEDSPVTLDYLAYTLLNSRSFRNLSSLMNGLHARVTRQIAQYILECNVAIDADKNKQHAIIDCLKQQYTQRKRAEMQAEMARLGIRDASSDLSHILGVSFDKISNTLASIQSETISEDLITSLHVISDNFMYMKRMINAVGADFSKTRLQIRDVEINVFINNYVSSWRNYGSSIFNLTYNSEVSDDTVLRIDEDMFRVLLDAILRNAYRHGFENKKSSDNQVLISTSFSKIEDTEYVLITIANNGNPFPEGFTLKDYVTRGSIAGKMGNTGLGGYHVWSIVERHHGHMNISSSKTWSTIIEILIPVEIYAESDADKFIEYGGSEYL